jgi:tetratricopeptide (TPR) repeat protein
VAAAKPAAAAAQAAAAAKPASPAAASKPAPPVAASAASQPATKSPGSRPPAPASASKAPQRSPGTVAPLPLQYVAADIPSLTKLLVQLGKKDYFGRLNVVRSRAPIPALKSSYLQLAKVYHPDTVPPNAPPEMRKLKEDVLSLLNEAYSALASDAQRNDYIDELEAKEQVGDLDVQAILAAEEDFQRATMLAKARKYAEALALLESCIQMNPKEGEFYAWRGFCRFFGAQDKRAMRNAVLEDLLRALELSPRCAVAWQFQGQVFKLLNETQHAKQAFQKTLEMDPGNVEAQRELRLYEQRKQ